MPGTVQRVFGTAATLLAVLSFGCGRGIHGILLPNRPPEVEITRTSHETATDGTAAYRIYWKGQDPDGRVDHYIYAVDPPSVDSTSGDWHVTRSTDYQVSAGPTVAAHEPHVFAVRAVDEEGAISRAAWFAYTSENVPPVVRIVQPAPSPFVTTIVPPSLTIRWSGADPDGATGKPVKYKFRLFSAHNPDFPQIPNFISFALQQPDSLRKLYAPGFAGWDSVPGDTTETRYSGLTVNQEYLFVITALDQTGDYDPVFSGYKNMLRMSVGDLCALGPTLCLFGQNFNFCYATSSCENDSSRYLRVQMPADQVIKIGWFGTPAEGVAVTGYRWVLDPVSLEDETPRSNEQADWYHWSVWSPTSRQAEVGPFPPSAQGHLLFVEAVDTRGALSLGVVSFTLVHATFESDLLFVDDTRLTPDTYSNGALDPPRGPWPTAAELDTFLFARGGFPWQGYPAGTLSQPGIFHGYDFDTLGTRALASGIVPLSTLSRYRTVVWFVDDIGAAYTGSPADPLQPITALRSMTSPGQFDPLATYMQQGGRVWLMGGGAAAATLYAWNRHGTPPDEFDNTPDGELVQGRFMYDFAHWRSALMTRPADFAVLNVPEFRPPYPNAALGRNWSGQGIDRGLAMPNYEKLRDAATGVPYLALRTCATDPPSPLRDCGSFYIISYYTAEMMGTLSSTYPNFIREDADPSPDVDREESTLDTLYFTVGGTAPYGRPVMTYYHGFESPQLVFSGFPIWQFQRTQVTRLSDFVLQDIFGLTKGASPVPTSRPTSAAVTDRRAANPLRR